MNPKLLDWREEADRWQQVNRATSYTRTAPNLLNFISSHEPLRAFVLREVSRPLVEVPEQDIYFLSEAYVSDMAFIYRGDGQVFSMSSIDQRTAMELDQLKNGMAREIPTLNGPAAFIFKAGKSNYGHLIVEMLPKLELLRAAGLGTGQQT